MAQIKFLRGLPSYNVIDIFVQAARNGTLSGSSTVVTLSYLDIVVTFEGSGFVHDGVRTISAGTIDTMTIRQGTEDLAIANGYGSPIEVGYIQYLLTLLDSEPFPDPELLTNALGNVFYHEDTLLLGSSESDQLQGSDLYFTDLRGGAGDDVILGGAGGNFMVGGEGNDLFLGSAGFDQIVYIQEDGTNGVVFDWNTGTATDSYGDTDSFDSETIEAVHGTHFDDVLIGDNQGRTFSGYAGDDLIQGGTGMDRVRYDREFIEGGPANGVTVNLGTGTATDSFGDTDTLIDIDDVDGTNFDDIIIGSDGENHLQGFGGNDTIFGGLGSDFINPGQGDDTIDGGGIDYVDGFDNLEYYDAEDAITVNKTSSTSGTVTGTWAGTDTFTGIEIVVGSHHDDLFNGSSETDIFTGMDGVDTFNGGAGSDWVIYEKERTGNGVFVNLTTGTISSNLGSLAAGRALDAFGNLDILSSIENIVGTENNDVIVGGDEVNELRGDRGRDLLAGNGGDDILRGEDGDDTLVGGAGNDVLDGGEGEDTVDYLLEQMTGTGSGPVTVNFRTGFGIDTYGDTDTYIDLEEATGTSGDDVFIGGAGYNGFRGFAGADTFERTVGDGGHVWVYYSNDAFHGGTEGVIINLSNQDLFGIGTEAGFAPFDLLASTGKDGFGDIDTYIDIHDIRGTAVNDWIMGSDGHDNFQMQAGDDYIDGGDGWDQADYSRDIDEGAGPRGIIANLSSSTLLGINIGFGTYDVASGKVIDSFGDTDTLVNIEAVRGTIYDDYLVGGDGQDEFIGLGGNDFIDGGGGDRDRVRYNDDPFLDVNSGIIVNFSNVTQIVGGESVGAGQIRDNYGDMDTVINVEEVVGTSLDDVFFGGTTRVEFIGGDGNDILHGSSVGDHLSGGNGDDIIYADDTSTQGWGDYIMPGYGNNTIIATAVFTANGYRDGHDLSFEDIVDGVTANLVTGLATSVGMTTTFSEVHYLIGGYGNDVLIGGNSDFDDFEGFVGHAGDDYIDGGSGWDEVNYGKETRDGVMSPSGEWVRGTSGVVVDLAMQTAVDSFGDTDTLINIEAILGTDFNDMIFGDANNNRLSGAGGADIIYGNDGNDYIRGDEGGDTGNDHDQLFGEEGDDWFKGGAGNDLIDGGNGYDGIDYDSETDFTGDDATHGVIVNLSESDLVDVSVAGIPTATVLAGTAIDTRNYVDTLVSIEEVVGTGYDDILVGSAFGNHLWGGGGDDYILGGGGNDFLDGGDGSDTVAYSGNRANYVVDHENGTITDIVGDDGVDEVRNFEFVQFADGFYNWDDFAPGPVVDPKVDFNGNGSADIFSVYSTGWVSYRDGSSLDVVNIGFTYSNIPAAADFDGDGRTDLLLEYESGWRAFRSGADGATTDIGFGYGSTIIGVGDFNGDGQDDTLLEYETGWRSFRNGADGAITDIGFSYGSVVIGLGDFDGDGKDDTLLEYETGWRSFRSGGDGAITDIGFSYGSTVVGIGDFDGDGKDDTLLAYDSGWLSFRSEASGSITDIGFQTGYEVVGLGDFDGDGQDDILLNFTATGWHRFISGGVVGQEVEVGFVYGSVVGIDDFNGDGFDDLLIRDTSDYVTYAPGADLAESVAVGDYTGQGIVHDMGTGIENDMLIA